MENSKIIHSKVDNVVSLAGHYGLAKELNYYIKVAQVITVDELLRTEQESIRARPIYSKFISSYERKWNKKYKNFNLLERDLVSKEFYTSYMKVKKVKI